MNLIKPAIKVTFINDKIERVFNSLPNNHWLKKAIQKVIKNLNQNAFCGKNIPKKQIPKEYIKKYQIENLYWHSLPNAWRLSYSLFGSPSGNVLATIVGYSDHKNYERRFNYQ